MKPWTRIWIKSLFPLPLLSLETSWPWSAARLKGWPPSEAKTEELKSGEWGELQPEGLTWSAGKDERIPPLYWPFHGAGLELSRETIPLIGGSSDLLQHGICFIVLRWIKQLS